MLHSSGQGFQTLDKALRFSTKLLGSPLGFQAHLKTLRLAAIHRDSSQGVHALNKSS